MPRKKHNDSEADESQGAAAGAGAPAGVDPENIVVGVRKDIEQQRRDAAGEKEGKDPAEQAKERYESTTGSTEEAASIRDEADPERKARDVVVKAHEELWKEFPETNPHAIAGSTYKKRELSDELKGEKLYTGLITLQSVSGTTHERVSVVADIAGARGEDFLFHVLRSYHPSALRDHFEIDPENVTSPDYRTSLE